MKKAIILFFSILSFSVFSQEKSWVNVAELDGVSIEESIITCGEYELLIFRISNENSYSVTVSWYEELWFDGICKQNGNSEEFLRTIDLNPNQIVECDCSLKESYYLVNKYSRSGKEVNLTHHNLQNIKIIKN